MGLEFTGERYVPELFSGKVSYEHSHRYIFARQFCLDKKVIGHAGEGYGSYYLSWFAPEVTGIEVSEAAIVYVNATYKKETLSFIKSSANKLPVQDHSQDVVVCFETMEHLGSTNQQDFLKELTRVLNAQGVLLILTPNKLVYSNEPNCSNPYHLKEFYEPEFREFLETFFSNVVIYNQQVFCGSLIQQKEELKKAIEYIHLDENGFRPGHRDDHAPSEYFLAVCSNNRDEPTHTDQGSLLLDESNYLYKEKLFKYQTNLLV